MPGYRFQALWTNLPPSIDALAVWRRYHGRADIEHRLRELGGQFGIKGLTAKSFWATAATAPFGHRGLQPVRPVTAAAGAIGNVRMEHLALAALWAGCGVEQGARQTSVETGCARGGGT